MATSQTTWDDEKAASFRGRNDLPLARCIFDYTLLSYMKNVKGKSVLDIGCGEGRFCRKLKTLGAARVVGVDISPAMLQFAREGDRDNFGCEYHLEDARDLAKIGDFDFVTSNGLLPFAETVDDLKLMCNAFYENLVPGGHFISNSLNCAVELGDWGDSLQPYGIKSFYPLPPVKEAKRIQLEGGNPNDEGKIFKTVLHYFDQKIYEDVFKEAGFSSFYLQPVLFDPDVESTFPEGFWDSYKSIPVHACYIAVK